MKYVLNESRYAYSFTYMNGAKQEKVVFDKKRLYLDTGNIATSGVTVLDDKVYDTLYEENKQFKKYIDESILKLTDGKVATADDKVAELEKENAKLKAKLNKDSTAKEMKKMEEEKAILEKENADMKAKLEALAQAEKERKEAPKEPEKADESEGF